MAHVRFFDNCNIENTFIRSVQTKAHWLLIGDEANTNRLIQHPIPLYNILTDLPVLQHTAWLIVSFDENTPLDEDSADWLSENILNSCPAHIDILFLVQPE